MKFVRAWRMKQADTELIICHCLACGSLVSDEFREQHVEWHQKHDRSA